MSTFNKEPITFQEQIERLISRGMVFDDLNEALRFLKNISYYKLSGYWYTFLQPPYENHIFKENTTFKKVIRTFILDRKLRLLIFSQLERIENSFKTQLIYNYSIAYGSNWLINEKHYKNQIIYKRFINVLNESISSSKEIFISHYRNKYTNPEFPPSWMSIDVISFGQVSILYKNLKNSNTKKVIAKYFGVDTVILESWMESLSYIRNICAHHSRLWNRQLPIKPMIPKNPYNEWIKILPEKPDRIFIILAIIYYLSKILNPNTTFNLKLYELLTEYQEIPLHYMGFPLDWQSDNFWSIL
ncbi:MAG: Abi family protein [Ignavibacteriae bacterium]|nr:Abi family protein [Ignavibacteriota bacterium]